MQIERLHPVDDNAREWIEDEYEAGHAPRRR
jgi:hypothetical protein